MTQAELDALPLAVSGPMSQGPDDIFFVLDANGQAWSTGWQGHARVKHRIPIRKSLSRLRVTIDVLREWYPWREGPLTRLRLELRNLGAILRGYRR